MSVHFWSHTLNSNIASYRLRCVRVIDGLRSKGVVAVQYQEGDVPEKLILSKRYDVASIQHALYLKQKFGTKLYLDLSDNHFYYSVPSTEAIARANRLREAICTVDFVISSSQYLAKVIRQEVAAPPPIVVIGDLVEFPQEAKAIEIIKHPVSWLLMEYLRYSLEQLGTKKYSRLIWFGNHGGGFADGGMNDISSIRPYLEDVAKKKLISLTLVSNSYKKYKELTAGWSISTFYVPWNGAFLSSVLRLHGISVIPIQSNPFTMAKTSNRVATSLVHGLQVIADPIPSYLEYRENIFLGAWKENLTALLNNNNDSCAEIKTEEFEDRNISVIKIWADLLELT